MKGYFEILADENGAESLSCLPIFLGDLFLVSLYDAN